MSHIKRLAKALLPPAVADAVRWATGRREHDPVRAYLSGGRVPWSPGYGEYRERFLAEALADGSLTARFRGGEPLPAGYGLGLDERCVEYPWLLAHLHDEAEVMLDAGSCLNHEFILDHPALRQKKLHILTLAPEGRAFWQHGTSYLYEDIRSIPVRDEHYDVIACLSTLEHVGFDNTQYAKDGVHDENCPDDYLQAMRELQRILKSGGTLFLTVPFGIGRNFGTFQQFDRERLTRAISSFGPVGQVVETFYRYTSEGWNIANAQECADCEYVAWIMKPADKRPTLMPVEMDNAAAARAVALVRLTKQHNTGGNAMTDLQGG